ncbi:MAG: AAA family ATPase [Muribaculaceae bacterium]|nr:AAA family ATPase [Muribaculaceae bacterium]
MVSPTLELTRQRQLLQLEWDHEREEFRRLTEAIGIERKVRRGDCWYPIAVGRSYYNSLNQLVVEIHRGGITDDEEAQDHNFEYGRQVMFFRKSGMYDITYYGYTATVSYAESTRMVVIMPDEAAIAAIAQADLVGVQLALDETTYRLMMEALNRVASAKGNRLAELRDMFYNPAKTQKFTFDPMRFPWLNATQERAVNEVLWAKDVAVVHGPPGTGKTTTLVEAIYETLRRENQVLVCAQSNMAVDWISERLMERGIDVLRIGNPTRVTDQMLAQTYERRFEAHPDYPQLWSMRKALREVRGTRRGSDAYHQKVERLKERITELELRIHNDIFGQARVFACTLAGSASRVLDGMKFATLFIDEAAQALEAACWIAIRRANRVILAGDHCQLPPTVKSVEAMRGGLGHTLMERIVASNPQVVTLLKVQYRMNDEIMRFSSEWFYHGQVESAPEVKHRGILDLDTPITWIDTSQLEGSEEEMVGENGGRINRAEAQLTMTTLEHYFERVGRQRVLDERLDVGIISPYRAQVQYLRRLLRRSDYFKPLRHAITVNTVDGFQGQERDVIVISLVRANEAGQIGFLRDLRRMNVAITRARMKLIILGDTATLTRHPFYARLYHYIQQLQRSKEL